LIFIFCLGSGGSVIPKPENTKKAGKGSHKQTGPGRETTGNREGGRHIIALQETAGKYKQQTGERVRGNKEAHGVKRSENRCLDWKVPDVRRNA